MHTLVLTHARMHTFSHAHTHTHMHTLTLLRTHILFCTHACMHAHTHAHTHTHTVTKPRLVVKRSRQVVYEERSDKEPSGRNSSSSTQKRTKHRRHPSRVGTDWNCHCWALIVQLYCECSPAPVRLNYECFMQRRQRM